MKFIRFMFVLLLFLHCMTLTYAIFYTIFAVILTSIIQAFFMGYMLSELKKSTISGLKWAVEMEIRNLS